MASFIIHAQAERRDWERIQPCSCLLGGCGQQVSTLSSWRVPCPLTIIVGGGRGAWLWLWLQKASAWLRHGLGMSYSLGGRILETSPVQPAAEAK